MHASTHTLRICRKGVAVGMLLLLTGGHWGLLQVAAWTRMAIVYSRSAPIQTALAQTFDGRHPCALCRMISASRSASRQAELRPAVTPRDTLFVESCTLRLPDPPGAQITWTAAASYPLRSDPPPVPPPRSRHAAV